MRNATPAKQSVRQGRNLSTEPKTRTEGTSVGTGDFYALAHAARLDPTRP